MAALSWWRRCTPYLIGFACGVGVCALCVALMRSAPRAEPAGPPPLDAVSAAPTDFAWTDQPPPAFPIPPYAEHLRGVVIVLDPGHVGQIDKGGNWKRGPTGLREAEANLRVAKFLREFLVVAGARVILTREHDEPLGLTDGQDLRDRARIANEARADLLLSIHHNAGSTPEPNHTLLFYHKSPDHSPASLCAARHLLAGLNDALRLSQHVGCPLQSDHMIYPDSGFALLRAAEVPAVLSEASFHSNPEEENRLRDPLYNRREAYGLFIGLARWAQAGLPRIRMDAVAPSEVRVRLSDGLNGRAGPAGTGLNMLEDSLVVRLNGKSRKFNLDRETGLIRIPLSREERNARLDLYIDFQNVFGQHVVHPRLVVDPTETARAG